MAFKKFKTERMLVASIAVLFLFLFASAFTKELAKVNVSSAEEVSGISGSNEGSQDNEDSQDDEASQDDEQSQDDEASQDNEDSQDDEASQDDEQSQDDEASQDDEQSQDDEKSEPSVSSTPSVRTVKTTVGGEELSEKSSDETSQQSVETSEVSEKSELSEVSEESIKYVEGYGEVISKEGNVALVKKDEKLFFLIPVEVESQVTLDEQGTVTDSQKSFLNWLLSIFSF